MVLPTCLSNLAQIVFISVKALPVSNTIFLASRQIKREKDSLPVDVRMRRSKPLA